MCRHLAWIDAPRSLASLLTEPAWSLERQSYQPRRQTRGLVNADGFGVGWYVAGRAEPVRYRLPVPVWTDPNIHALAPVTVAAAGLAAVRSATVGMPIEASATAPFTAGRWLFSLNGSVAPAAVRGLLGADIVPESTCDAAVLAAVVLHRLVLGEPAEKVVAEVVTTLADADPAAVLNLLLTDGASIVATAHGASLAYAEGSGPAAGGVLVASEPVDDDPGWVAVADHTLLVAGAAGGITCTPLETA